MKPNVLTDIMSLSEDQLLSWLQDRHIAGYRAAQILKWIYQRQADTFDGMTDLNKDIRLRLAQHFFIPRLKTINIEISQDGTRKYLFGLEDKKQIETVLIPGNHHDTVCISSQAGCSQGCRFCLTAAGGWERNLSKSEIICQVRDVVNDLPAPRRLTNIVLMGMGEPLANYGNVVAAVNTICDRHLGLQFSSRRFTLSTAGVVPMLARLGRDLSVNLAVSLNAADDRTRDRLMPINQKYPLQTLIDACRTYPLKPRRKITFEYILIKGINDAAPDALALAKLLKPLRAKINLIPFNQHAGTHFKRPDDRTIFAFQAILHQKNYTAIIRKSRGSDISAACGQLRLRHTAQKKLWRR
jgi:23S rRNA (adenine2503-C2)-methyltransferase